MADAWWTGRPAIRVTRWMPHIPHPKQHAFLWLDCQEAFYGGAAGGGKSDALLLGALQYVDVPGYAALLLRRTYPELSQPGGLISRSHEWLSRTDARWREDKKEWKFPSGATITFGYLKHDTDKYRYQGAEFQYIGFDELTQFRPTDYTYLFSRLRRLMGSEVPIRMRSASNPGGSGHRWVKARFPVDGPDGSSRIFIPASLWDNPSVDRDAYMLSMAELDDLTRAQLLEGDWNVRAPGPWMLDHRHIDAAVTLGREWQGDIDRYLDGDDDAFPPPANEELHLGIDWGEITQGYTIWELERGGVYIPPSEAVGRHEEPGELTERFLDELLKFDVVVGEARYDAAGVQSMRTFAAHAREYEETQRLRTKKIPFNKYKRETINYMRYLMGRAARGHKTQIMAIDPRNEELIAQLYGWERKDEESDEAKKEDDHGPDAVVAGVAPVASRYRKRLAEIEERQRERKLARQGARAA